MSVAFEKAVSYFQEGYACSQAVLAAFGGKYGLDETTALRIATGFGGGVKCGEICGAATGAVMVIGLKYGHVDAKDKAAKAASSEKAAEFLRLFREKSGGAVTCRGILGCDITTPEGKQHAMENKLFTTVCLTLVITAVELLEELGY